MAVSILQKLIQYPTTTPRECGIFEYIQTLLPNFESLRIEKNGVENILFYRLPQGFDSQKAWQELPHFCFGGHVDVVNPGGHAIIPEDRKIPLSEIMNESAHNTLDSQDSQHKGEWQYPPFQPTIHEGYLYGRGAQDMKGGIACFLRALQEYFANHIDTPIILSVLLTSDEEGDGVYGTQYMLEVLKERGMLPTHAIVAEPTSVQRACDTIKVGRRGSINGVLRIYGKQGHVAYPEKCVNPVELLGERLGKLAGVYLDSGDSYFSASKLVITDIRGGVEAVNVTPNDLKIMFNVRNSTMTTPDDITDYVQSVMQDIPYQLNLTQSSKSFVTPECKLTQLLSCAVQNQLGITPELSTSGGTSDARFFSEYGVQVVEIGVCNDRIHAIDERVALTDLQALQQVFLAFLESLCKEDSLRQNDL